MKCVIKVVFASGISIGVEVAIGIVAAGEDGERERGGSIVIRWACLGTANGARVVRAANCELVVVGCEGTQSTGFDLHGRVSRVAQLKS